MNGFWAVFRKELTQMIRDRGTFFFALFVPVGELILFGVIDMNAKNIPTAVFDQSRTQESRRFVEQLDATGNLRVTEHVLSRSALQHAIVAGRAREDEGDIDAPLAPHPTDKLRMAVAKKGGRPARTGDSRRTKSSACASRSTSTSTKAHELR